MRLFLPNPPLPHRCTFTLPPPPLLLLWPPLSPSKTLSLTPFPPTQLRPVLCLCLLLPLLPPFLPAVFPFLSLSSFTHFHFDASKHPSLIHYHHHHQHQSSSSFFSFSTSATNSRPPFFKFDPIANHGQTRFSTLLPPELCLPPKPLPIPLRLATILTQTKALPPPSYKPELCLPPPPTNQHTQVPKSSSSSSSSIIIIILVTIIIISRRRLNHHHYHPTLSSSSINETLISFFLWSIPTSCSISCVSSTSFTITLTCGPSLPCHCHLLSLPSSL